MKRRLCFRLIICLLVNVTLWTTANAQKPGGKEASRFVTARVVSGSGAGTGIGAAIQPGEFTIPAGHEGFGFKFSYYDRKSSTKRFKLGPNHIYSVTEHRYINEAENNSDLRLPPGKYRFVVGGGPGAYGSLGFKVVPRQGPENELFTDGTQGKRRTVVAHVVSTSVGVGIHAIKQPTEFTIPKGHKAIDFKYSLYDPASDFTSHKLTSSNIFSVTEGRYCEEAENDPSFELPEGKYKFVIGGRPRAEGRLSFTVVPVDDKNNTDEHKNRTLRVVTWVADSPEHTTTATFHIRGNQVTGLYDQIYEQTAINQHGVTVGPQHHKGVFSGTISGDVITGVWKTTMLPVTYHFVDGNGKHYERTDTGDFTTNSRTVLNPDGTVTETLTGKGTLHWRWSASAPVAQKSETHETTFRIPDKDMPSPVHGTWKDVQ